MSRWHKIPWDDPDFSRRMLREHLSQDHDMASRRFEWIDRQVRWIHDKLLCGRPSAILDLGCGPGFYSHRLAALGHRCRGIDFGPASIEYAKLHGAACEFLLGDIREVEFGGPYDLAMFLFGEMNVFPPEEVSKILRKARCGHLIVEIQTPDAVEQLGHTALIEEDLESGIFSDQPYRCVTESRWIAEDRVAVQTFTVTDFRGGKTRVYRNVTKAWKDQELKSLLEAAGFERVLRLADWPCNTAGLALWRGAIG